MPFTWETMHEMYLEMMLYKIEREEAEKQMRVARMYMRLMILSICTAVFAIAYDFIVSFKMN